MLKTEDQFKSEIEQAENLLSDRRKSVRKRTPKSEAGIKCDFDLPYSSFPELLGRRRFHNEKNA